MAATADTQLNVWYCKRCRQSCKVVPPLQEPACTCASPVPGLRPTRVTLLAESGPKRRPLQALTEREAGLRALARRGQQVRVTFEGEVVNAWMRTDADGITHIQLMVLTPDGNRHIVNPMLPGSEVDGIPKAGS